MLVTIDGVRYVKEDTKNKSNIGIGITTHNRNKLVASTVAKIRELSPGAKIVVVDDASESPVNIEGVIVYRFKKNVGIARAKNKCLELLRDTDHIFLFDDDTYPIAPDWYVPYVESSEPHLMYLFESWSSGNPVGDDEILYEDGSIVAHKHARGCMLYVNTTVLDKVGGMDTRYGKAMHEHLDWSNRIHNAGLTSYPYMDVVGSEDLIHSMDEHQEVSSSIPRVERRMLAHNNNQLLAESEGSSAYAPYGKNLVLTSYFSGVVDPQRDERWTADHSAVEKLEYSVTSRGLEFDLIHNCFDLPNLTTISGSPYFERWLKQYQYLRDHPEVELVFVTDATDVDMLFNPFPHIDRNTLYVGDEPTETLSNQWLLTRHVEPTVNQFFREHPDLPLLNCGVVGGSRRFVMELCHDMYAYYIKHPRETTDMGVFNYLMHTKYAGVIDYGRHVTTEFKKYERRSNAWFRHK